MSFLQNKRNLAFIFIGGYSILLLWLSSVWYNSYTSFHFFNDLFEWEYLDKVGHFFTSFQLGFLLYKIFGDSGNLNPSLRKKWICFSGFLLLLPMEILDGFSMNYGFSPADVVANGLGSIYCYSYVSYKIISDVTPKFSFHTSGLHQLRPELLGYTFSQQIVKDYNGQSYWFSMPVNKLIDNNFLPDWLLFSVGYGADGMLGGHDNVWETDGDVNSYTLVARSKRIFISFDVNATMLREKNKFFSYVFAPFVLLKFPAPTLEINSEYGIIFHPFYF